MLPSSVKRLASPTAPRGRALLVTLLTATSVTVPGACVERRGIDDAPAADASVGAPTNDADGTGGSPSEGSDGESPGGMTTATGTGGAPRGSGGGPAQTGIDAGTDANGSGGAGTGGVIIASSGGTGGVVVAGSGGTGGVVVAGSGGTGGAKPPATGSGGTMGTATDAGMDSTPTCGGANHLCGSACVANTAVTSCGSTCSSCPVPAGGTATCDGTRCGIACPAGKSCGGTCIAASACCADGDCPAQNGAAGKCNATTNACQYPMCGNSMVEMGEQCDPPKTGSCSATCLTITGNILYTFNTDVSPWTLYVTSPDRLAANTRLSFDAHGGEGSSGALKVEAPFDAANQKVELQDAQATMLDMSKRTIHARVRLVSGLSDDSAHPGAIKLFAKSGANYDYASGVWTYLTGTGWADVTLVADQPDFVQGTFAPAQVRQIGFELRVFSDTQRPAPAVVDLDSIWY